ncbi:MAG: ABC transporter permease [Bradyrhizobium sp.]|nr:MAG: ABC transporter permease [Bradyrhizobium sp.]
MFEPIRLVPRGQPSPFWTYASPALAIVLTVIVSGVMFFAMGKSPGAAVYTFLVAPLVQAGGLSALAVKAAPLIMMGAGLALCYRASVWNIGCEGQFTLGAICAGGVALAWPDLPAPILYPAAMIAGVVGGAATAALSAWLRTSLNVNEILSSLMMTYVAQYLLIYLVTGPWRDPQGFGFPQTAMFSDSATTPILIPGSGVHLGCLFAPLAAIAVWALMSKSTLGFQLRVVGEAPRAARFAGFSEKRLIWVAMLVSGGLAGLAGMFEVTGPIGQLTPQISPGYGFTAVIVAFLGRLHPIGAIFAGLLLALSYLGGDAAQIDLGLPNAVTGIFQGVLLFLLLACDILILYRPRLARPSGANAGAAR